MALSEGLLVRQGTPRELMTGTTLAEVFGTPVRVDAGGAYPVAVYYR